MTYTMKPVYDGGGIDNSLTQKTKQKILSLPNGKIIIEKLKDLIGYYRYWKKVRETYPNKSTTITHLENVCNQIIITIDGLNLIPPDSMALIEDECWKRHGLTFCEYHQNLENLLRNANYMINRALSKVDQWKQTKGERPKILEHKLLTRTALLIEQNTQLKKIDSAGMAAELLISNGVHNIPSNPTEARRVVLKVIKQYGEDYLKID